MLGEVYGHVTGQRGKDVKQAIEKALQFTRELQIRPKVFLPTKEAGAIFGYASMLRRQIPICCHRVATYVLRSARNAELRC